MMKNKFLDPNKIAWLTATGGILLLPLWLGDGYYLNVMNVAKSANAGTVVW